MKPEPTYVDCVPLCTSSCQHAFDSRRGLTCCEYDGRAIDATRPCEPAIRNLVAQVAEVKRLCQSHNNPGAHKLAGDVLRILEDGE